uniref:Conserved oligomeric Golgi complex subunit 3 C-terminal domain-containing protein n=1 Tax=Compsopogon caeruleus TaxID=31354 RepID=A0A7S1XET5_9RHOD
MWSDRTVAPRIKSLVSELHARARTEELGGTSGQTTKRQPPHTTRDPTAVTRNAALSSLGDCEESFVDQRRKLIQGSVLAHVKSLGEVHNTVGLARAGSSFILRLCQMEKSLYEHFFPIADTTSEPSALVSLLKSHCSVLYEELRPRILSENDLEKLVYLIEVLRQEFPGEDILRRELPGDCLIGALTRCIADAQERLIFRAEVFIRDEIRGFVPSATNLNYPDIILDPQATRAAVEAASHSSRESGRIAQDQPGKTEKPVTGIYATWYPTVERTLRLLSMLYRCIDRQVFSGIAQEAVSICLHSVSLARMRIAASRRPDAEEHAQLFFIWQMLMLREQISPFDVEFAYTEKEFDFTETRLLLGRVLRGQAPLLTLSQPPRIRQRTIDSKRLLEQSVQTACEAFILKTTRLFLDPILAFLAKCNVLPVPDRIEAGDVDGNSFTSLKQSVGSFAHPSGLRQMWEQVCDAINTELTEAVSRLSIYVTKPTSRSVLLRPIRANFAEAASELISALQTRYTLEEREEIGIDGEAIQKELDSLDEIFGIKVPQS